MTTCALVAASDFNGGNFEGLWKAGGFDEVIAVDAGYAHLEAIGCEPDAVVGDFDSLGYAPACSLVVELPVEKDKSDLEVAMDLARAHAHSDAFVYGALGGRLDHTIANLQMCARFAERGMRVTFVTDDYAVRIVVGPDEYELPDLQQGTVSVFSATDESRGVVERGMKYPLDDQALTNRTTWGLSNELQGSSASVAVREGTLYVFHPLA